MESNSNCERCNRLAPIPQHFSCGHTMCSQCITKIIFFKHFNELSTQENIQLSCTCKHGVNEISIATLREIISTFTKISTTCVKHKAPAKVYCLECKAWLCEKRIELHQKLASSHQLREEQNDFAKCTVHPKQNKEVYCHDCKVSICEDCEIKGAKHEGHHTQWIEDYANHLRSAIPLHLYDDASSYIQRIDNIADNFQRNLQIRLDLTLKRIDQLIKQLKESKKLYIEKMKQTTERAGIIINLFKFIYSDVIQSTKTTQDVNLLQDLAEARADLAGLNVGDDTEKRIKQIEDETQELNEFFRTMSQSIYTTWRPWEATMTLTGHTNGVWPVIQLQDGRLVSGSGDSTIKTWEVNENAFKNTLTLAGHGADVNSLIQLKDGRLASGSFDKTIKIWEISEKDYKNTLNLIGHTNSVLTLIQLQDGRLASGSWDNTIKIWEPTDTNFKSTLTLRGHSSHVWSLIQLKDGRLVSGSRDLTIKVWEVSARGYRNSQTIAGHTSYIWSLLAMKDGRLISGSCDTTLKVWRERENMFINTHTLSEHSGYVLSLVELKDGRIASGSTDKTIRIWEVTEKEFRNILTLAGHSQSVYSLIQMKDGRIVSGSDDKTLRVWKET